MLTANTARWVGHNTRGDRQPDDYYATPESTTLALLKAEKFIGTIWEPCCGEGHISKVLAAQGYEVESSDLVDRGFGIPPVDALMELKTYPSIVTNPPYKLALEMAEHFTELGDKVALLLKLVFLEGIKRREFFERKPPVRVYVFSQRQAISKDGIPTKKGLLCFAWFVWERGNTAPPRIGWL